MEEEGTVSDFFLDLLGDSEAPIEVVPRKRMRHNVIAEEEVPIKKQKSQENINLDGSGEVDISIPALPKSDSSFQNLTLKFQPKKTFRRDGRGCSTSEGRFGVNNTNIRQNRRGRGRKHSTLSLIHI
eukprot:TRINITY_DN867_c0_g1_i3.p1 TRINITY_DN867_c0_g1~~TRINITY_DN867_c0_g1_i3.p1  ORF type:complete len:127 (-),score=28.70 TRINITY_DN867_c0_g1_i3:47-427(-)